MVEQEQESADVENMVDVCLRAQWMGWMGLTNHFSGDRDRKRFPRVYERHKRRGSTLLPKVLFFLCDASAQVNGPLPAIHSLSQLFVHLFTYLLSRHPVQY